MRNSDRTVQKISDVISQSGIAYAILDKEESCLRILIAEDCQNLFKTSASKAGWKAVKDKSGDLYLYGTKRFMYYSVYGITLIVCCQLACRSTLNDGWVPLDRKINGHALEDLRLEERIYFLGAENELCYLTAKCIYTEKNFCASDIKRIEACMSVIDRELLLPKLEGIFFRFTDGLLQLLEQRKYIDIIPALWRFAAY